MLRSLLVAASALLLAGPSTADIATVFGQADDVWDAQVSPDGKRIALGCGVNGYQSACIYELDNIGQPQVFYTGAEVRLQSFYWASDHHLVGNVTVTETLDTVDGNREYDISRAIAFDVRSSETAYLMRNQRGNWLNLTNIASTCPGDPDHIVMQIIYSVADTERSDTRLQRLNQGLRQYTFDVNLNTGRADQRDDRPLSFLDTELDENCEPLINTIYNDENETFEIEYAPERRILFSDADFVTRPLTVVGMNTDSSAVIVRADSEDLYGMYTIAVADGEMSPMTYEGYELGRMGVVRDPFSSAVMGFRGTEHLGQHYYTEPLLKEVQTVIEDVLPGETIRISSFNTDQTIFTLEAELPGRPVTYYVFEPAAGSLSPLGSTLNAVANTELPSVVPISYAARDGLQIPGYVTLPPGKTMADGPFPTVIMPHGGPEARDTATFDWWSQAYGSAGYAVIRPNFRGSAGYGAEFRDAGFGEFGGKMIDDMVDAIAWAKAEGIAGPEGVCAVGASYGGYASLMMALKAPEDVHCVVAVAPVTDIVAHMARFERDTEPYRYWSRYTGQSPFSSREARDSISPIARIGEYRADVMLIHGEDDLVVELGQSRRFRREWGNRSGLSYVTMENGDHFLRSTEMRTTVLKESLDHLAAHHPAVN